ncbi:MAG: AI-2E family transporter [Chloroflexota bacterium]|nr:AI-2E family transporter [Chloroflexota bacterium]
MNQHDKWSKEARYLAAFIVIAMLALVAWYMRAVFRPLAIAALLSYVLYPIVKFLSTRTRLSHRTAVIIVYILALLVFAAAPAIITPMVVEQFRTLAANLESILTHYEKFRSTSIRLLDLTIYPRQFLPKIPDISTNLLTPLAGNVFAVMGVVTKNFIVMWIVLISFYYFLRDGYRLGDIIIRIAPEKNQSELLHILERFRHIWSNYIRSQLAFMLAVGLLDTVAWLAIGLPGAVFLGIFAGLTSFVHEVGAILSGFLIILVALLEGSKYINVSNIWFAVIVLALYILLTGIKNAWLRPIIVGRAVSVHSGVVFVIVIGALMLHGTLAAFLAIPVLLSLLEINKYLRRRILGLPPFPEEEQPAAVDG